MEKRERENVGRERSSCISFGGKIGWKGEEYGGGRLLRGKIVLSKMKRGEIVRRGRMVGSVKDENRGGGNVRGRDRP